MFCDLVGSTALGQRLDVEDYTEVIEAYVRRAAGAVEHYGGYVAQVRGDGVVAYFGFPTAHEDDAERAVRAGLEIQEALAQAEFGGIRAVARIGIHTGLVVLNHLGESRRELLALGDTSNTAARIESMTPPGSVGISEATRRLVQQRFLLTAAGQHQAKGIDQPLQLYVVEGLLETASRGRAMSPDLVGRTEPVARLTDALSAASETGAGRAIAIIGDPGIGKSRLTGHVTELAAVSGCTTIAVGCSALSTSTAFTPIIELVRQCVDQMGGQSDSLPRRLEELGVDPQTGVAQLLGLAGIAPPPDPSAPALSPELARAHAVRAVEALVSGWSRRNPLVLLCEDLHWADPSTMDTLGRLAKLCPSLPLLLLVTSRPGLDLPTGIEALVLDRLEPDAARDLVRGVALPFTLDEALVDQLVQRSDGVPLFLEQLTVSAVESGPSAGDEIPATLQESLTARLDRLGPARALSQVASLLGRELDREVLCSVTGLGPEEIDTQLASLVANGILHLDDDHRYQFRHALIQDAAASSLVRRTRRRLHGDIVDVLNESFPTIAESEAAYMAHHCVEAERSLDAIGHFRRAAARAASRFANREASDLLARAIAQYDLLEPPDRTRLLEIELRSEYGGALSGVHGLLSDPVVDNYRRIETLEQESPDPGDRLAALLALTAWYPHVSEMRSLMTAGQKLLDVAGELGIVLFEGIGHLMLGIGATGIEPETSIEQLTRVELLAEQGELPPPFSEYSPDLLVLAAASKSTVLCAMGQLAASRERIEFALHRSEIELAHPNSTGTALTLMATHHAFRQEPAAAAVHAQRAVDLAVRHGFSNYEAMSRIQLGWAITSTGGDGSDEIRAGFELLETSTLSSATHQHRLAADEAALRGAIGDAKKHLDQVRQMIERNGERGQLAIMLQSAARIEVAEGRKGSAARTLREAIRFAAEFGSWTFAFQSAVALLELQNGDDPDAARTVREIYPRLNGADDLPAVVKVRSLLDAG